MKTAPAALAFAQPLFLRYGARIFLFFLLIAPGFRCTHSDEIRLIGKNFGEEVGLSQNLIFTFNKNLRAEHELESWDSTAYITFEPAIRGKFKWSAPNELTFSPAGPLPAAADYKATLSGNLLKGSEKNRTFTVSKAPLHFHTPYLQLVKTRAWWALSGTDARPEPRLELVFNYPVTPKNIAGKLKILKNGASLAFGLLPSDQPSGVLLSLRLSGNDTGPSALVLRLDKGLRIESSSYETKEISETPVTLPSPLELGVSDVETGFENNQGFVQVFTSQELTSASLEKGFTLQPGLPVTTEKTANGFILRGNFSETETYLFKLGAQLKGVLGHSLAEEVSRDLFFGKMPPGISFVNQKAQYLTPKGNRNIGVRITNIPKVQVKIFKIYENNILQYLNHGRYANYSETGGGVWSPDGTFQYTDDPQGLYSDVVVDKQLRTADLAVMNGVSALNIAIPEPQGGAGKGIYLVSVGSTEEMYLRQNKLVSISDIGLIVKQGTDGLWVFANSIHTAMPLADTEITLISSNNQAVYTLNTDSRGMAFIDKLSEKAPGFRIAMITARRNDDFNYLFLSDTRVETSRFEVEGSRSNPTGLQAYIYGERDIYRPGETLNFNVVVRSENWETTADFPVKLKLLTPNGRVYQTWRKTTNRQGAVAVSAAVAEGALTGAYTLELYNANDVLLAARPVNVEEFIPDRIKVTLSGGKPAYRSGETVALQATALNLFGPPAANRNFEMEAFLTRKQFQAKNFPGFSFEIPSEVAFERTRKQGTTDAAGIASEKFPIPSAYRDIGLLEGKVFVTVFDESGRAVNRVHPFSVYTQPVFFGVRLPERYVSTNVPLQTEIISVTPDGALKGGTTARIEVIRLEYQTIIEKNNNQLRYTSRKKEQPVYSNVLKLAGGKGSFSYTPVISGEYEVRIRRSQAAHYTACTFFAYGYGSTQYASFEVSNEGRVLMETDKPRYVPGDKAKVLFKTPFDGKLLVTVEQNSLLEHHVLDTDKKAAELTLKITDRHLPNLYVAATLLRPLTDATLPLTVAHGFVPLTVEAPDRRLDVQLKAVTHSRSKTKQRIHVKTRPGAQLTIALVDEGILQIRNFSTPDIYGHFYQKRALEVSSHDLYAFLFPELSFGSRSSSGGDGLNLQRRINPLSNGRTDLVRFWSGILEADRNGEAVYEVDLPQFSGDLRVMAVAYKGNAFGSASQAMKVADPIVISTGAPRFLSPGDVLELPVTVTNTGKKPADAVLSLEASGTVARPDAETRKVVLQAGQEQQVYFTIKSAPRIGEGSLLVKVRTLGETFSRESRLNVRPASPLLKINRSGVVAGGTTGAVPLSHSFLPGTSRSELVLSRSPLVQGGGKALADLLRYPHGCLEQAISRAFPQLYFAELSTAMARGIYLVRSGQSDFNPVTNVQQAIRTTESLQLYNGSFTLWPGSTREDDWLTAYAVHFLHEAQRAGFEISPTHFRKATEYLTARTGTRVTEEAVLSRSTGGTVRKTVAPQAMLYSLYVLALAGQPNRAAMNYYKQHTDLLTNETRYLLAAAYQFTGDTKNYTALLPATFASETRKHPGHYASPLRDLGLVLNTLLETDPQNLQIPVLARQLSQAVASASYLNTQEAAFAVLSLGKIAKKASGSTVTAEVLAGADNLGTFRGPELTLSKNLPNGVVTLKTSGKGNLYWFAQTEGMNTTGVQAEEDAGLRVRRAYLDRNGKPLASFRRNELVVVKITLSSTNGLDVPNVVVTDLLPAGFEVENPRLTETREMPWIKSSSAPDYFDIRDDRIHYFTTAGAVPKTFYYQARITSGGVFTTGPVAADAMYQGTYKSYSGGGKITVH